LPDIEPLSAALSQNWIIIGRLVIAAGTGGYGGIDVNGFENGHISEINEVPKIRTNPLWFCAMLDEHGGMTALIWELQSVVDFVPLLFQNR
jgi:hypothetical protein